MNTIKRKWQQVRQQARLFDGSIGKMITGLFVSIIILFILFFLVSQRYFEQFTANYENSIMLVENIREIDWNIRKSMTAFTQFLHTGNEIYMQDYQKAINNSEIQLLQASQNITYEEAKYVLPGISNMLETYNIKCNQAAVRYRQRDYSYFSYYSEIQIVHKYLEQYCEQLIQLLLESSTQEYYTWESRRVSWMHFYIVFIVGMVLTTLLAMRYIQTHITKPMYSLAKAAKIVSEGNFSVDIPAGTENNEVSILCNAFSQMVKSIQRMLIFEKEKANTEKELLLEQRKNEEYKVLLEQTKFLALQSQTNPHFMFNTLNSIKATVMLDKKKEAMSMLDAFAIFMRYNLKNAEIPVLLEEEVRITQEYLKIQKYRFGDRIQTQIDYDESIMKVVKIPRFTLQPIVENSMIHGLEKKIGGGVIKISIIKRNNQIRIRILDNGIGMPREKLAQIRNDKSNEEKRIGIENIRKRLQIYYGQEKIFHIFSKENVGTLIVLKIPWEDNCV